MKFAINCPECNARLQLSDKHLGKKVKCRCGALMRLPKSLTPDDSTNQTSGTGRQSAPSPQLSSSPRPAAHSNVPTAQPAPAEGTASPSVSTPIPTDANLAVPTTAADPSSVLSEMEDDLFGDELFANDWYKKTDDPLAAESGQDPFAQPQTGHGLPTPNRASAAPGNPNVNANAAPQAIPQNPNAQNSAQAAGAPTANAAGSHAPTVRSAATNPNLGMPTNEVLPAAPATPQPTHSQPTHSQPIPNQPAPVPYATNLPGPNVAPASPYQDPANYQTNPNVGPQNPYVMPTGPTTANLPNNQPYHPAPHGGPAQPAPTAYPMPQTPQTEYERKRQKDDALLSSFKEETDWRNSRDDSLFGKASGYGFFAGIIIMLASVIICSIGLYFGFIIPFTPHAFVIGFIISVVGGIKFFIDLINSASQPKRR